MVNIPSNPAMVPGSGRLPHKAPLALAVCVCLAMYAFDLAVLHLSPTAASFYTANFAIPFDLMVCVPLVFYLLFVRRRGITPIAVLPVIYLGGLASSAVAVPGAPSALPALFSAALVVDAVVLVREIPRLVRAFREGYHTARKTGAYPIEWFTGAFEAAVPSRAAARVAATEIAMWYYLLFSWRRANALPQGKEAFSYHKSSGFVALIGVILAMGAVEIVVVHLLVAQYSAVATAVISVLSVYCLAWVASFARAVVASPLLLGGGALTVV